MKGKRTTRRKLALRFSLRSLLVVVTLLAIWIGIQTTKAKRTRIALDRIAALGGNVRFAHQYDASGTFDGSAKPNGPRWLRNLLGGEYFDRVVYINLADSEVTDDDLSAIATLGDVKTFWLARTSITDQGAKHLAKMKNLESLFLAGTAIGDEGLRHLRSLSKITGITLNDTRITDQGLAQLSCHQGLVSLNVSGNQISGEGLVNVHDLPKLEYMDLKRTQVTNSSLMILGERTTPWWLDVRDTAVTDEGIAHLIHVTSLTRIEFNVGQARPDTIDLLRRELSNCTVVIHRAAPQIMLEGFGPPRPVRSAVDTMPATATMNSDDE